MSGKRYKFKAGDVVVATGFGDDRYEVLFVGEQWAVLRHLPSADDLAGGEHTVQVGRLGTLYRPAPVPKFHEGKTYALKSGAKFRVYEVDDRRAYGMVITPMTGEKYPERFLHTDFDDKVKSD